MITSRLFDKRYKVPEVIPPAPMPLVLPADKQSICEGDLVNFQGDVCKVLWKAQHGALGLEVVGARRMRYTDIDSVELL